jgi:hypothetical protein
VYIEAILVIGSGVFLLMERESEDEARSHIEKLPSVRDGWLDYQIDPINATAKFD